MEQTLKQIQADEMLKRAIRQFAALCRGQAPYLESALNERDEAIERLLSNIHAWRERAASQSGEGSGEASPPAGATAEELKKKIVAGDWFSNEYGNKVTVMAVASGWCMVMEENREVPDVLPEEFVLATFNP